MTDRCQPVNTLRYAGMTRKVTSSDTEKQHPPGFPLPLKQSPAHQLTQPHPI